MFEGPEDYHERLNDPDLAIDENCILFIRGVGPVVQTDDRASLVVGKYLSPRVLLKYVLDLEAGQGYSINVEYWLRGGLRLMTTTSRYSQSGLELNWSHDY